MIVGLLVAIVLLLIVVVAMIAYALYEATRLVDTIEKAINSANNGGGSTPAQPVGVYE